MPINSIDALDPRYHGILRNSTWVLCVGAGISRGITPDWLALSHRMLEHALGDPIPIASHSKSIASLGWSLDSWIQVALNEYISTGRTIEDFNAQLAQELYSDILAQAEPDGLKAPLEALLSDPFNRSPNQLLDLSRFLNVHYGSTSLLQIARVLLAASDLHLAPEAVLTLNADVLLHATLTLLQIDIEHDRTGSLDPDFTYRAMHHAIERPRGKTPIYHIHGSITPSSHGREAREKLIFPESAYLQLASAVYSWPQTTFLSLAQYHRIVFVGLSMSDPNIRRWLSWCHAHRRQELEIHVDDVTQSSQHLWITTLSSEGISHLAKEVGLQHLGVRTAYVPDWGDLEKAFGNLLSLP